MKWSMLVLLASMGLGLPAMTGCDRTVSHEQSKDVKSDGTVKRQETTVTEKPDGSTVKHEENSTNRP